MGVLNYSGNSRPSRQRFGLLGMSIIALSVIAVLMTVPVQTAHAAITYRSAGAVAYSATSGTSVSPAYPGSIAAGDMLVLIIGMKPSTANSGSVTTPSGWIPSVSITGAGGYGTTLGADTGNTNLFAYYKVADGTETGSLVVTIGTNSVSWAQIYRFSAPERTWSVAGTSGSDTAGGNVSITFADPGVTADDYIISAMCIPTDVTTPTQFSAELFTQNGVTFGTVTEISEPDSANGNDIGGFAVQVPVNSGTGSANPTMTATAGGTTTNVRGPGVFIRVREVLTPPTEVGGTLAVSPDTGTYTNGNSFTITEDFTEAESAVTSCQYTINGGTNWYAAVVSGTSPTFTCTASGVTAANGTLMAIKMRATSAGGTSAPVATLSRTADAVAPVNGTVTPTAGDWQVALSWSGFSDAMSGLATTDIYKVVKAEGATAPANCNSGAQVYLGTATSTTDTRVLNDTQYSYRVCAYDRVGNLSTGATASATPKAPLYSITNCHHCHSSYTDAPLDAPGGLRNTPAGATAGSHNVHTDSYGQACTECHLSNGANFAHRTGIINMTSIINATAGSSYSGGTSITQTNTPTLGYCSNTYCHSTGVSVSTGSIPANTSPTWGGSTTCSTCHSAPPAYASGSPKTNSHSKHPTNCSLCHNATTSDGGASITNLANHGNKIYNVVANAGQFASYTFATTGGTCNTVCCHGGNNATWGDPSPGCVNCHNSSVCSPKAEALDAAVTSRRAVGGEFAMTWSHKRTASGVVTNNDCGVCHMEGIASSGLSNTTYHANGTIELRDPDTGATIKEVYFNGGTPGAYVSNTGDATFVRFSRDLSSNVIEPAVAAIQINQCLKCHDGGGAASTAARVPSGTALRPFNTAPTHTIGNNVLDVDMHFTTTNSSYHPVKGKQNNSYVDVDLMLPPFNQMSKTAGTTTSWGDLISCWDCHARPTDSGALTNTVTAHGGAVTLRGASTVSGTPSGSNAATLCLLCHDMTTYNQATPGHGPNSAASNLNRIQKIPFLQYGCNVCHSSGYDTAVTRPTRSEDVHGTNSLPATGQTLTLRWSTSGTPIAFIRNRSYLSNHEPLKVGATNYSPQCDMVGTDGGGACTNQGPNPYTVGGTY